MSYRVLTVIEGVTSKHQPVKKLSFRVDNVNKILNYPSLLIYLWVAV